MRGLTSAVDREKRVVCEWASSLQQTGKLHLLAERLHHDWVTVDDR